MKGRPLRDGDGTPQRLPRRARSLDEGPPAQGRRPGHQEREDPVETPASMKGRPLRDGDQLRVLRGACRGDASMKGRPLRDGDRTPEIWSWEMLSRPR